MAELCEINGAPLFPQRIPRTAGSEGERNTRGRRTQRRRCSLRLDTGLPARSNGGNRIRHSMTALQYYCITAYQTQHG
ncbi:MAG: hypothetical protein ACK55Z_10870 [bacterium]